MELPEGISWLGIREEDGVIDVALEDIVRTSSNEVLPTVTGQSVR